MINGSKPTDGGNLLLSGDERDKLIAKEPEAAKWIRPYAMSDEFINGINRYCLWLVDCPPDVLRQMPLVLERIKAVRKMRAASTDSQTKKDAATPSLFQKIRQPDSQYLVVPRVSSERRHYVPIAFASKTLIAGETLQTIPNATLYHFGVITSTMHMDWMRTVCGRLKSDFRYSNTLVYNNFPWPQNPTPQQVKDIETKAQAVLDARAQFPDSTLSDLYDPLTMPPVLLKTHQALDKAVDLAYRRQPFDTARQRIEYLFGLYQQLTDPLITAMNKPVRKRK